MNRSASPNFSDYRTVGEAAEFLGVSTATLRNWDRSGKLKPQRHPQNGYRIYLHEDLESVLRSIDPASLLENPPLPPIDWNEIGETEHFVQFYESDEYLIDSVSGFVGAALAKGESSVIIATPEHRAAIGRKLSACGIEVNAAIEAGRFVVLDAAETLAKLMVAGAPDSRVFAETVGQIIAELGRHGRHIHAFGEMVALLWSAGDRDGAIRLEELWNELGKRHRFALFCAYPMVGFNGTEQSDSFDGVCSCHSKVLPVESYSRVTTADDQHRAIALLQQKAFSLEAEIAHRKEVELALSMRERELADFFDNATEGLHKVGPDGTILWANHTECSLLGYAKDEYIGRAITEFHADEHVVQDVLARLGRGETLDNYPARLRCKNGAIKHVLINSSAYFDDGKFAYTRCFTRDVTELKRAEKALREADRRKDEFLATLAHELRNPLAPISNAVEMLRVGGEKPEVAETARSIIERQVGQMVRLVDDLLDISRITRGRIELRKERVAIGAIIKSAVETSRPLIDAGGHELAITLPMHPIHVEADPTRMAQVFSNLLNNAAKYTPQGGQIQIEAKLCEHQVVVSVRDNGVGISCDALAYVFDMFRQSDRSLERAQGGLGIGLALVRRLVELHGGTITALSEGHGLGSEFVVQLAVATPNASLPAAPQQDSKSIVVPRRILVVDDNADSRETLSALLRIKGHNVRYACDGLKAVEAAAEFLPEVILMDVGMPLLNGYEATRRIREAAAGREIFIIALTGWGQQVDIERSTEAGCSAHLVKPLNLAVLERLLDELPARAMPARAM